MASAAGPVRTSHSGRLLQTPGNRRRRGMAVTCISFVRCAIQNPAYRLTGTLKGRPAKTAGRPTNFCRAHCEPSAGARNNEPLACDSLLMLKPRENIRPRLYRGCDLRWIIAGNAARGRASRPVVRHGGARRARGTLRAGVAHRDAPAVSAERCVRAHRDHHSRRRVRLSLFHCDRDADRSRCAWRCGARRAAARDGRRCGGDDWRAARHRFLDRGSARRDPRYRLCIASRRRRRHFRGRLPASSRNHFRRHRLHRVGIARAHDARMGSDLLGAGLLVAGFASRKLGTISGQSCRRARRRVARPPLFGGDGAVDRDSFSGMPGSRWAASAASRKCNSCSPS